MVAFIIIILAAELSLGTGRTIPSVAALVGLVSVIAGGIALLRPATGRIGAPVSLLLGVISAAVGGLHAAYAAGGVGTGNGLAGAIVAVALGLIGIVLGALALARSRRTE